ncbi:MAG: RNA polymerase sigma factor [Phycisphaeraceae bacterium]|nr:MAG: RNA polymerase sigma factor [Phycisphaeraceae bacterium]
MTGAERHSENDRTHPRAASVPSDESLFLRFRDDGDTEAYRDLIDRYHDDLLRFLYRMLGDRQGAEDVFQEAFLQAHLSAGSFDENRRFRPWLFTIAANKARDLLRKKGRRKTAELSAPIGGDGGRGASFVDLMETDVAPPDERLTAEERDRQVQKVLNDMSPTLREVLLLAYFQRLSYAQIADELGIPLGTVKSRLHSAVAVFGKGWQALNRGETDV